MLRKERAITIKTATLKLGFVLLFAIGIAFYTLGVTLLFPHIGIAVTRSGETYVITNVNKTSWAHERDIRAGDRILSVDGQPPGTNLIVRKFAIVEKASSLDIRRGQEFYHYEIESVPSKDVLIAHTIVPSIVFIVFLLLSGGLFSRQSSESNGLFYFLLATAFCYISAGAAARGDFVARIITSGTLVYIPVTFLFFLQSYFAKIGIRSVHAGILRMLIAASSFVVLINVLFMFLNLGGLYPYIRFVTLGCFAFGIIVGTYYLLANFVIYRSTHHAAILKIMLAGITLAFFPFLGFSVLPLMVFGFEIVSGSIAASFVLALPLVFFYLVTAKRLVDINFMLDRLRYYSLVAALPAVTLFLFIRLTGIFSMPYIEEARLITFLYFMTIGFLYAKELLDKKMRKFLFRNNGDYQESLQRFTRRGVSIVKMKEFEAILLEEVQRVIPVESSSVMAWEKNGEPLAEGAEDGAWSIGALIEKNEKTYIPLGESSNKKYVLELGRKKNRTKINEEERQWLNTLAQYVSIMITNLALIEGLTDELQEALTQSRNANPMLMRTLFSWSEKERRRLAFDLHDTALQDQLLIYRKLETLLEQHETAAGMEANIADIKERVLDVIYEIRHVCNELRPPFLQESGIIEAMEQLIARFQMEANFKIRFFHNGSFSGLHLDYVLTIYRVVQELLWNAMKHSQASEVHLSLIRVENDVHLDYIDNGVGVNLNDLKASDSHIGLSGISGRITSLGGFVDLDSKPGEGFSAGVKFPIQKAK